MMDVLSQTSISEVVLLFVLVFIVPMMTLMLLRLRRYENLYGPPPGKGGSKKAGPEKAPEPEPAAADAAPEEQEEAYDYQVRPFMSNPERACLDALREVLGPEVEVFPKVALWEYIEPEEKGAVGTGLDGLAFDYLVCDRKTMQPLTAVMFNPGKGRPAGRIDETRRVCEAAGANLVFIDQAEEYDAAGLKQVLGIPDLDI